MWQEHTRPSDRLWFTECARLLGNWDPNRLKSLRTQATSEFPEGPAQAIALFHLDCVEAMHDPHRGSAEPSAKTLVELQGKAPVGIGLPEIRALCRELAGHHRDPILAHSVTPVLLVPTNGDPGAVLNLHLELIQEAGAAGHLYAAPVMHFVDRDKEFDKAITHAKQWLVQRNLWPKDADIRWRFTPQFSDIWFHGIEGDSAGGDFLFGLLQLLAQAKRLPTEALYDSVRKLNEHPHGLRGVVWMCTVTSDGQLDAIGEETEKFRGIRDYSRPAIHTVVAAPDQEADIRAALNPENKADGIHYLFETDPLEAVRRVVAEVSGQWRGIFDYRNDWERQRSAHPRPWLGDAVEAFQRDRAAGKAPGWCLLDAHARFGKSAFAAGLFGPESSGVAGHFFREEGGRDSAEKAVRSVLLQLCLIHRLAIPDFADLADAADRIFPRAAEKARERGDVQIVVLDGLDRCADFAALEKLVPAQPPEGLAFIATTHPWMKLGRFFNPACCRLIPLPDRKKLTVEIRSYLHTRRREFAPPLEDGFLDHIAKSSQGLIGLANDLLEHPELDAWRRDPETMPDGPGAWQGNLWPKSSDLQKIEDYRRRLIEVTGTVQPLVALEDDDHEKNEKPEFPIAKAYVPMTTAPPKDPTKAMKGGPKGQQTGDEPTDQQMGSERESVPFREMFEYLSKTFPGQNKRAIRLEGEPGSGKTTASRQIAWMAAQFENLAGLTLGIFPVWLRFQEMREGILSLEGFLIDRADGFRPGRAPLHPGTGEALLKARQPLLWILDGFDEIATPELQMDVAGWIDGLIGDADFKTRGDRVLLTSRPLGNAGPDAVQLDRLSRFELSPLEDAAQREFVDHYLRLLAPAREPRTDELMSVISAKEGQSNEERRMARNPMLLSLICYLFTVGKLPDDWDDLYEEFVNQLLRRGYRNLSKKATAGATWRPNAQTLDVSKDLLGQLAWWMQGQDDRVSQPILPSSGGAPSLSGQVTAFASTMDIELKPALPASSIDCLDMLREEMGLLCFRGGEAGRRLGFLHLNIQEYLAARHAAVHGRGAELAKRFGENPDDQREVVRLAVKLRQGVDNDGHKREPFVKDGFHHDLFLGLLDPKLRADELHDVFLSRLVEMAGAAESPLMPA